MEEAKITKGEDGLAYFEQGDIKFPVPDDSITRAVDVLDKLNSGMWQRLAAVNHLPTDPFDKKLLKLPLMGVLQIAWYKAFDPRVDFPKLIANQERRVVKYRQDIERLKANPDLADESKRKSSGGGGVRTAKAYQLDPAKSTVWGKYGGQKKLIVDAMQKLGPATAAVIADTIKGQLQTRQPAERVVAFYMNDFGHKGLLTNGATSGSTEEPSDEVKQSPVAAADVEEVTPQEVNKKPQAAIKGKKKK